MQVHLKNKTALVTGATGKLGPGLCMGLARQGVNIVVHCNKSIAKAKQLSAEIKKTGVRSWVIAADFEHEEEAGSLIERAIKKTKTLDIVINNASIFTKSVRNRVTMPDLSRNLKVNTVAPLLISRAFRRVCKRGTIIHLLDSRAAGGDPLHAGYIVSKQVLLSLTPKMALDFAPGISVNAVAPGLIGPATGKGAALLKKRATGLPLKKHGDYGDVAQAVIFLLQSSFITGQVIYVDGGRSLRESAR